MLKQNTLRAYTLLLNQLIHLKHQGRELMLVETELLTKMKV